MSLYIKRDYGLTNGLLDIHEEATDVDLCHNDINVLERGVFLHLKSALIYNCPTINWSIFSQKCLIDYSH